MRRFSAPRSKTCCDRPVVDEAQLKETDAGLVPATAGRFGMNARDARWFAWGEQGSSLPLTGCDEYEAETFHWETDQEDFLVLSGEATLIVEGEERLVRPTRYRKGPR